MGNTNSDEKLKHENIPPDSTIKICDDDDLTYEMDSSEKIQAVETVVTDSVGGKLGKLIIREIHDNIPLKNVQDPRLHINYKIVFGFVSYFVMFFLFLYSFLSAYEAAKTKSFISLDENSGNCLAVPKPFSQTFKMDTNGFWEGSVGYTSNLAKYEFEFDRFDGGMDGFAYIIDEAGKWLTEIAQAAYYTPLSVIMIFYMGFETNIIYNDKIQLFRFTGSPRVVFNTDLTWGGFASPVGSCYADYSQSSYNPTSGKASILYNLDKYSNSTCKNLLDPTKFKPNGFIPTIPETLEFSFNIESVLVAISINALLISIDNLMIAGELDPIIWTDGMSYGYVAMYYPKYPTMDPVYCMVHYDSINNRIYPAGSEPAGYTFPTICTIKKFGDQYLLPTINHIYPGCNECPPKPSPGILNGTGLECDKFLFYASLIYFPDFNDLVQMIYKYYSNSIDYYYSVMFDSIYAQQLAVFGFNDISSDPFGFCNNSCYVFSMGFVKETFEISPEYLLVPHGHCVNTATTPNWEKFKVPPISIVEPYFECTKTTWEAFYDAIGISSGFASTIGATVLLVLAPLVYFLKKKNHVLTKEDVMEKFGDALFKLAAHQKKHQYDENNLNYDDLLKILQHSVK